MRRLLAIAIIICAYALNSEVSFGTNNEPDNSMLSTKPLSDAVDLHFTGKYCTECHEKVPKQRGDTVLKYEGDFSQLCRCHYNTRGRCPHPVELEPSKELKARIPADLPLRGGKIACSTCHDIYMQCQESKIDKMFSRGNTFLRGAPFSSRTSLCFKCHDQDQYTMLNPHNQLDESGDIVVDMCLYCHVEKPDEKDASYKDVKLIDDLEMLCVGCHNRERANNKSLHASHIVKPSAKVLARIKQAQEEFSTILPLDADGKVTCVTCHNPHEKGVIPPEKPAAKGAGETFRHRTPGNMCIACHLM
jgi:hypothetical protein